jgi:hypothetical protein
VKRKIRWASREVATPPKRLAHKVSREPIERHRPVPRKVTDTRTVDTWDNMQEFAWLPDEGGDIVYRRQAHPKVIDRRR